MRVLTLLLAFLVAFGTSASAQTAVVEYYHLDAVGSVRAVTNQAGQVVRTHNYFAFGDGNDPAPPSNQDPLRFAGKARDAETGLDYFGARHYRARSGRFTTVDPFLDQSAALINPQRWNRYAYALNNPLRNGDPDGKDTIDLVIGFGQGIRDTAVGLVKGAYALATDPRSVGSAFAAEWRLLKYGVAHPGEVLDTYVTLARSANDADQRTLGAAFGRGTAVAALVVAPTPKFTSTTRVVHYTDAAGKAGIESSGALRAGTYVTKPSQVRGMTAAQIESRLEIAPGRGTFSFSARVPNKNLRVPENGPMTSGGAWQRQLADPVRIKK
jgi:RHS repeat-associated protein